MKTEFVRFKWEDENEYKYRFEIFTISDEVQTVLENSVKIAEQKIPDYEPIVSKLKKILINLEMLIVPQIYINSNKCFIEALEYYVKGYNVAIDCIKKGKTVINPNTFKLDYDSMIMLKSGNYITCGNYFAHIVSVKNFDIFTEKQKEYDSQNMGEKNVN